MNLSPIVLFCYNRLDHLKKTVNALSQNNLAAESRLIIYSDAPRDIVDEPAVRSVRSFIRTIDGFLSVDIVEQKKNRRLAPMLIEELPKILEKYGKAIILEDDIVTSPYFLSFMNDGLERYADDGRVISIHGYMYPIKKKLPEVFCLKGADCWGWATWERGWRLFEEDAGFLLESLKKRGLLSRLDFFGAYNYSDVLAQHARGKPDGWDVRWYASALLHDKLTLYPGRSLVKNIGFDGTGMHCGRDLTFDVNLYSDSIDISNVPVEEDDEALMAVSDFLRQVGHPSLIKRVMRNLRMMFR